MTGGTRVLRLPLNTDLPDVLDTSALVTRYAFDQAVGASYMIADDAFAVVWRACDAATSTAFETAILTHRLAADGAGH